MAKPSYVWTGTEWLPVASAFPTAHQRIVSSSASTAYTLGVNDTGKALEFTSSSAVTITIPKDADYEFVVGQTFLIIQKGSGTVTISPDTGVTLNGYSISGSVDIQGQYGVATLIKLSNDNWLVYGNVA
jgi:hypothetical protein